MINREKDILPPLPTSVAHARVPSWDLTDLVHRNCPSCRCDTPSHLVTRADNLVVARCEQCSMMYLPDTPSAGELEKFYSSYGDFKHITYSKLSSFQCFKSSLAHPYIRILEKLCGLRGKALLEVGCAFGHFLQLARYKGASVHGIELDCAALKHLSHLEIHAMERIPKGAVYDIACAFQILEHLADPETFIADIADALVDDGALLLSVPNGGEAEHVGRGWVGFRVDFEHLNYFTVRTIGELLMKQGLYIENIWTHTQPLLQRATNEPSHDGWISRVISAAASRLRPVQPDSNCGSFVLTVLARKVSKIKSVHT